MKMNKFALLGAVVALTTTAMVPELAMAAIEQGGDNLETNLKTVDNTFSAIKTFLLSAAGLGGLYLFIKGIWLLYKHNQNENQDHAKKGIAGILIGSALMGIVYLIGVSANSVGVKLDKGIQSTNETFE